ncbi:Protein CBG26149 [Caenorhabditis briggsae]|uniref:Protein CBG26149 n=2 Tax=Caenorhabditis briggsae TaxID=6238 RepID=B6IIS3_CAEBR|nr:Protein CBG26149 [Caenorhabditis briggsae]CAR99803.1 Protein CBG26149 [Caenorhabditis briggsae]
MQGITEKTRKKEMINFSDSELNLHKSRRPYFRKPCLVMSRLSTECVMTRLKRFKNLGFVLNQHSFHKEYPSYLQPETMTREFSKSKIWTSGRIRIEIFFINVVTFSYLIGPIILADLIVFFFADPIHSFVSHPSFSFRFPISTF